MTSLIPTHVHPAVWIVFVIGVALCLWGSLRMRRRHRLYRDLPTSKVRGVFIGLVELKGTAESEAPLVSHLAKERCVFYKWRVEEHWSKTVTETYTDANGKRRTRTRRESGWTTVDSGGESSAFYLADDTGAILIKPGGASIGPARVFDKTVGRADPLYFSKGPAASIANSDHQRRFSEMAIPLHAPIYVVGPASERDDIVAPQIAAQRDAESFLISTSSEEKVASSLGFWSWALFILGLFASVVTFWTISPEGDSLRWQRIFCAGGIYFSIWGMCWVWMVFNSLVRLRNRVHQALSLIDVQLKRRHDLIPPIAAAVAALASHEQATQQALAALRAQIPVSTVPGGSRRNGVPDIAGVTPVLRAVLERYPALCAQEGFSKIHGELTDTEHRVALARAYYNDIATHYATRIQRIPECWIGALGSMKPPPLFAADALEREQVDVKFAQ